MTKLECLSRLIAVENGRDQSEWLAFAGDARTSFRQLPLTDAEIEAEDPDAEKTLQQGIELLSTGIGRIVLDDFVKEQSARRIALN